MIDEASLAMIPADIAGRAAIGDMQLAAAMAAAQETRQERLAAADRAARHETFAVGVVGDQALIPLELGPREMSKSKTSQSGRSRLKPRTIRLRPASIVTRLPVRPKA
jgi:hypothetical protein